MTASVLNHIGGRAVAPVLDGWFTGIDPATGQQSYLSPRSTAEDVDRAVTAAAGAFVAWRRTTPAERCRAVLELASVVERHADELAELESRDTGKPLGALVSEEIEPIVDHLRFFAGAARTLDAPATGEYLWEHTSTVRREPVGVCAQLLPWNYPLLTAIWKAAPALSTGNTVVLKPAETTPASAVRFAELATGVLPPGVVNVVCGGRDTGRLLAGHPGVAMVALTGSVRAGREVAATAGANVTPVHLELGGNACAVVDADADLPRAAREIAAAAFLNAGQDCAAVGRVLVAESSYEAMVAELVRVAQRMRVGPPSDREAEIGPLNNADQLDRVAGLVERARAESKVVTGGNRVGDAGYFYAPTVIVDVSQGQEIVQEEVFGPVLTVQPFATLDQALELANGVDQGLTCSVWTSNHGRAMRLARLLEFGTVWINTHLRFTSEMPHGGYRDSGHGLDLSTLALAAHTRIKHVMTCLDSE